MPALLKSKRIHAKTRRARASKKSFSGPGSSKSEGKTVQFDRDAVDEIVDQLKKELREAMAKGGPEKARQKFGFNVIIDGKRIRVEKVTMAGASLRALLPAKEAAFDPEEAGRKVVKKIQEAEGGAWTGAELLKRFDLTPATLHKRRSEHRIVTWRDAKNQFHYPKWQFTPAGALLPGVQEVLQIFRSSDEWRVMSYFLAPKHQLGDRPPLDLLRAGEVDKVIAHAKANGEENSW